jgi:hypothetical protein
MLFAGSCARIFDLVSNLNTHAARTHEALTVFTFDPGLRDLSRSTFFCRLLPKHASKLKTVGRCLQPQSREDPAIF